MRFRPIGSNQGSWRRRPSSPDGAPLDDTWIMTPTTRTAIVTGANRGIGLAIAQGLAAKGDIRVLAAARRAADARATAAALGEPAVGIELDLSDPEAVEATVAARLADHGPIDILVNNAAMLVSDHGPELATADLAASLAVNTVAPYALIRVLGPAMARQGWGRIVNLSSGWGAFDEGMGGPTAYAVSKAALNALTASVATRFGSGVLVNAVCPGWVRTRMGGEGASRTPAQGADTPIWLATLPADGPTGGFFRDRKPINW